MPPLTRSSLRYLDTLTHHTRVHAQQLLQEHRNLQVSSGLRSPRRNKAVGGVPTSWHLRGRAVDLVGPLHDLQHAATLAWLLRVGPRCTGPEEVILENSGEPGQHLHIAW
jgi:uncharacterized protein YcbK (DUF882 family)